MTKCEWGGELDVQLDDARHVPVVCSFSRLLRLLQIVLGSFRVHGLVVTLFDGVFVPFNNIGQLPPFPGSLFPHPHPTCARVSQLRPAGIPCSAASGGGSCCGLGRSPDCGAGPTSTANHEEGDTVRGCWVRVKAWCMVCSCGLWMFV